MTKAKKEKLKRPPPKTVYTDESGNTWSGRGPRPRWLRAALESGRSLQDFAK
ncbi:H-NS family nucleoid-associated regulatory protein [Variovorax sp. J31P207]|nr:H-NS family nucleoid-associated regulatory protein [Variovorax sp. J31P207]MDM0065343.1 H-NS family nucleoid-associated regulatory protein [Variovorax sp. J31P207]